MPKTKRPIALKVSSLDANIIAWALCVAYVDSGEKDKHFRRLARRVMRAILDHELSYAWSLKREKE